VVVVIVFVVAGEAEQDMGALVPVSGVDHRDPLIRFGGGLGGKGRPTVSEAHVRVVRRKELGVRRREVWERDPTSQTLATVVALAVVAAVVTRAAMAAGHGRGVGGLLGGEPLGSGGPVGSAPEGLKSVTALDRRKKAVLVHVRPVERHLLRPWDARG
jgi:hypothetical protein